MPIFPRGRNHVIVERPYAGSLGAKLYVAAGEPTDIIYRPNRVFDPQHLKLQPVTERDLSVATVTDPTEVFHYTLPAALVGVQISCQVRTFANDYENETIYRPRTLTSDGGGDEVSKIMGTGQIVSTVKLDGGGRRIRFIYKASLQGVQPEEFALVKTAGTGTIADVVQAAFGRADAIDVTGLTDGQEYTFRLEARATGVTALNLDTVTFTADGSGPTGTITLTARES